MFDEEKYLEYKKLWRTWLQENEKYKCPICNKEYSVYGIGNHLKYHFGYIHPRGMLNKKGWSKGLTKETDSRLKKTSETSKARYACGELKPTFINKKHTEETKRKISETQKRLGNLGVNNFCKRWKREPSYAEKFIISVIENELIDKNYISNMSFFGFELDFAWVHLKKCIEIDGEQHYLNEYRIDLDNRKNKKIEDENWKLLRIRWKYMKQDYIKYIALIKDFIDSNNTIEDINRLLDLYNLNIKNKLEEKDNIKKTKIQEKIELIRNSDVDYTRWGWGQYLAKIVGYSSTQNLKKFMMKYCPELIPSNAIDMNKAKLKNNEHKSNKIKREKEKIESLKCKINKISELYKLNLNKKEYYNEIKKITKIKSKYIKDWVKRNCPEFFI